MKKGTLLIITMFTLLVSCSSMKNKSAAQNDKAAETTLAGSWELDRIPYNKAPFDSLYKEQKPRLTFDLEKKKFSGNSSCNSLSGALDTEGKNINFKGDILMTMKGCFGDGEPVFMENLKKVTSYNISADGKELTMIQGDVALMHFHRK